MGADIEVVWANKHGTERMCWNCEHVEYVGDFEGEGANIVPVERTVECRASHCPPHTLNDFGYFNPELWVRWCGRFADGSKWWCSEWRPSSLPVPPLPPEAPPPVV